MNELFSTLIKPHIVLDITAENLFQFSLLDREGEPENGTVTNQLKVIAWNRAGPNIQYLRDLRRVDLYWDTEGVRATIYEEKFLPDWEK